MKTVDFLIAMIIIVIITICFGATRIGRAEVDHVPSHAYKTMADMTLA